MTSIVVHCFLPPPKIFFLNFLFWDIMNLLCPLYLLQHYEHRVPRKEMPYVLDPHQPDFSKFICVLLDIPSYISFPSSNVFNFFCLFLKYCSSVCLGFFFFINNANLSLEYNRHHFYTYFDREYSSTPSRNIWCRYLKTRLLFKRYLIDWLKTIYIDRTLQDNVVSVCLWC